MSFLSEFNKELNSKIYYKSDERILIFKLDKLDKSYKSYKIKELLADECYKHATIKLFISKISTPSVKINIADYLSKNCNKSDIEIYTGLQRIIQKNIKIDSNRGENRIKNIKQYIDLKEYNVTNYLDVGCFDGKITKAIGQYFALMPENIHGADIKDYRGENAEEFTFAKYDRVLPYDSDKFDLITILMVLHHIKPIDLDTLLAEIARVTKKNGILIMREHTLNPLIKLNTHLLDVLHAYYDFVLNPDLDKRWTNNVDKEINNYQTDVYWTKKLAENGFIPHYSNLDDLDSGDSSMQKNPFGNKIIAFMKII